MRSPCEPRGLEVTFSVPLVAHQGRPRIRNGGRRAWLYEASDDEQRKRVIAAEFRKVALVQALREAYPGAYGGIYDSDEMPERPAQAVEAFVPEPDAQAAPVEAPALDEPPAEYYGDAPAEPEAAPVEAPAQPDAAEVADEDYDF